MKIKIDRKKLIVAAIAGAAVFTLSWFISSQTILLEGLERRWGDFLFTFRAPGEPEPVTGERPRQLSDRVRLVAIDDASINEIGRWPWYRDEHARYLENLAQFSPGAVHLDVMFDGPAPAPETVKRELSGDPRSLTALLGVFAAMDQRMATALGRMSNDFIDLFMSDSPRFDEQYVRRAPNTERAMEPVAQLGDADAKSSYGSLSPVFEDFARVSQPLVANVWKDKDSVLRNFSLLHPYKTTGEKVQNYASIPLGMLMAYYRVGKNSLIVSREQLVITGAKVPLIDAKTGETAIREMAVGDLSAKLELGPRPANYNENLHRAFLNEFRVTYPDDKDKIPVLPVVLLSKGGKFQILEGREIWDAAVALGSLKVRASVCTERDLTVRFRRDGAPYSMPINYGQPQVYRFKDPASKLVKVVNPIPNTSAKEIYRIGRLPEVPPVDASGRILASYNQQALKEWFIGRHLQQQVAKVNERVRAKYGKADVEEQVKYTGEVNPELGKYCLIDLYFANVAGAAQAPIGTWDAGFRAFLQDPEFGLGEALKQVGVTDLKVLALNEKSVLEALNTVWLDQFSAFYNKFVFTAAYATGMADDMHETPFGTMYGINAIIWAFSTVATESQLRIVGDGSQLAFLILVCLLLAAVYGMANIRIGMFVFIGTALGTFVTAFIAFDASNTVVKVVPLVAANLVLFVSLLIYKLLTEEKDKQFLKATFSSYLAPELINQMYESKTMPKLGGEPGIRTAFFTDIQGFSTFSEKLTAEQLVELLNEYLNSMTNILLDEKGTLDKYIGDAIIGIFGAPMPLADHSLRALRVAVGMQANLARLREKWRAEVVAPGENRNSKNLPPEEWEPGKKWPVIVYDMRVRVGINSGDMVTGNMGSTMRMNYTMMGDPVNLAARLEAGAKQFGVYTLVSGMTLDQRFVNEAGAQVLTRDLVHARFIDRITVVGKSEPVEVFEVIGIKGESDISAEEQALFTLFEEGVKAYQACEWDKALGIFQRTKEMELFKKNKYTPSKMYIERCEEFKVNPPVPPGEKWDGVFRMTQKH
ncbi:MAG: adenylate/guanylate cyclase domain-containing protein [Spirochaetes bacterium]|nr:adenylate/guanylate cyclase domain-containing protein [Spirochaetota bacterium]